MIGDKGSKKELIRVYVEIDKGRLQIKLPVDTTILCLEEYLKRTNKLRPTESVFLFVKEQRRLMTPERTIGDYCRAPNQQEVGKDNPNGERMVSIVVRRTDAF